MDDLTLRDVAHLLHLGTQEVVKLAESGRLPGTRRAGRWEFHRRELLDHLAHTITNLPPELLTGLERGLAAVSAHHDQGTGLDRSELLLSPLLCEAGVGLDVAARTRASILSELVTLAERTELVWDGPMLAAAVRKREDLCSTALEAGVAVPHPRRTPEHCLAESLVVFARTASGIHFGALDGQPTDLFFLVACTEEPVHLRVLARLCRILRRTSVAEALRTAERPTEILEIVEQAERDDLRGG